MRRISILLCVAVLSACNRCDVNQATNKMLALGSIQGRIASRGGQFGEAQSVALGRESGKVSELIAQQKYDEACALADEVAKKLGADLETEQKNIVTIEQLAKDGGKGSGTCSVADAAKKQMEIHGQLQAEVSAGRKSADVMREFGEDTKAYGELLTTNPSEACALLERVRAKHGLPAK